MRSGGWDRVPAPVLFVVGGASMYVGAAVAVGLFDLLSPATVAMLRIMSAALVLLAWRRPGGAAWRGRRAVRAAAFGVATAGMNIAFYEAVARLPLGTAVAIEFCGPVAVAALASRRRRDVAAVLLAAGGVACIADVRWSADPAGVAWALAAAVAWAAYIVLGKRLAGAGNGVDDMAVGFSVAAVLGVAVLLFDRVAGGVAGVGAALAAPSVLGAVIGVGVLSSVVPYVLDQVVLRRVGRARFAVLLALLPATATFVGLVVLGQVPGAAEGLGIAAVVAAVALRSRDGDVIEVPERRPGTIGSATDSDSRWGDKT